MKKSVLLALLLLLSAVMAVMAGVSKSAEGMWINVTLNGSAVGDNVKLEPMLLKWNEDEDRLQGATVGGGSVHNLHVKKDGYMRIEKVIEAKGCRQVLIGRMDERGDELHWAITRIEGDCDQHRNYHETRTFRRQ